MADSAINIYLIILSMLCAIGFFVSERQVAKQEEKLENMQVVVHLLTSVLQEEMNTNLFQKMKDYEDEWYEKMMNGD